MTPPAEAVERVAKQLGIALEAVAAIAEGEGGAKVIARQALDDITRVGMEAIALAKIEQAEAPQWTFDDEHIGLKGTNSLRSREIRRPEGMSKTAWYAHARTIIEALSTPANVAAGEGDERFCAVVWAALKGDHNDLRKQAIILEAHRSTAPPAAEAEVREQCARIAEGERVEVREPFDDCHNEACNTIAAAIRSGAETEGDGWLPIETFNEPTALSSGEGVLIADAEGWVGEAYFRNFGDDSDGWWWVNTSWGDYPDPDRPTPTHWRPLTPPPSTGAL
jgi:hypothetical protein